MSQSELDRIRSAYRARDASTETPYRWDNPGYVTYMQSLERALLQALADADVPFAGARVLDVGCGSGYFLHRLREYGAGDCVGIDLMDERVAAARRRYPALDLRVGSATELPFADGEFDLVTQFTCLSSIIDAAARTAAAGELQRVAGPTGWILSFDMRKPGRPGTGTPTVGLDERELRRLFGRPHLLRSVGPGFALAQLAGRRRRIAELLGLVPPLRTHLLGIWAGSDSR
jgi:SAM-dependent methyltransferase